MPNLVHSSRRESARIAELADRELLLELASGNERALDELIERKSRPLLQLAWRVVGDREDARDVEQLTFLRVWEHRERYNPRYSPNTWIYRIATNLGIDVVRARATRQRQSEPVRNHFVRLTDSRHSSMADLEDRDVTRILHELASDLTERRRAVFVLREVEGMPSAQVAEILGCRASTVRNHLFAARKVLRRELGRRYPEYAARQVEAESEESSG